MIHRREIKRSLLYLLVASVVLGAVLGIVVVARNTWGWFEVRVVLTTVVIAVASLCGLACELSRMPRGANLFPSLGLALTLAAAGLNLVGLWFDLSSEEYWKTAASASIMAVATVHACLLSIARLAARFRWVLLLSYQVVYGLAVLLCVMIFGEISDDGVFRLTAAVAILDAAFTLVIPLLHRISKTDQRAVAATPLDERNVAAIDQEIASLRRRIAHLEELRAEIIGEPGEAATDR